MITDNFITHTHISNKLSHTKTQIFDKILIAIQNHPEDGNIIIHSNEFIYNYGWWKLFRDANIINYIYDNLPKWRFNISCFKNNVIFSQFSLYQRNYINICYSYRDRKYASDNLGIRNAREDYVPIRVCVCKF